MRQLQPGLRRSKSSRSDHHHAVYHTQNVTGKDRGQLWKMKSKEGKVTSLPEASTNTVNTDMQRHTPALHPVTMVSFLSTSLMKATY